MDGWMDGWMDELLSGWMDGLEQQQAVFLNTVHFRLALALGHTSPRVSAENLACLPEFLLLGRPSALFFFWGGWVCSSQHYETPEISAWSFSFFLLGFLQSGFGKCLEKKSSEECSAYHFIAFHIFPDVAACVLSTLIAH